MIISPNTIIDFKIRVLLLIKFKFRKE